MSRLPASASVLFRGGLPQAPGTPISFVVRRINFSLAFRSPKVLFTLTVSQLFYLLLFPAFCFPLSARAKAVPPSVPAVSVRMVHPDSQELDRERSPVPEGYTPYTYEFRDRHGKMQRERLFLKNTPIITESEVEQARIEPERRECLHITLNTQGGKTMKAATSAMNLGRDRLALVVQGKIKSAPVVQAVISRTFEISGLDGKNEASGLAELLNRQAPTEKNTPFIPQDLALYAVHPESRRLVEEGYVSGWDDPRMPTLCGLRRRGYTPTSIFTFVREAGISKSDNLIDMRQLEACIRSELDLTAQRRIAVLEPVKLVVDNYPADKTEYFDVANNPNREANDTTTRKVAFTRELWIESEDFAEVPPPKFKRLTVGGEVRLMGAYIVKCESVEKNADGSIAAIHCTADLETGNGNPADGRKVKGTIHWVSAAHCVDAEVRLYDKLFTEANMNGIPEGSDYKDYLNPESVTVRTGCKLEESLKDAKPGEKFQFVRTGFFTPDSKNPGVYNRVVTLRDSFKPAK